MKDLKAFEFGGPKNHGNLAHPKGKKLARFPLQVGFHILKRRVSKLTIGSFFPKRKTKQRIRDSQLEHKEKRLFRSRYSARRTTMGLMLMSLGCVQCTNGIFHVLLRGTSTTICMVSSSLLLIGFSTFDSIVSDIFGEDELEKYTMYNIMIINYNL
ncbi:Uncharacterized protein TCM_006942 [Theobroma cacao]|uniref:Uncharacterized protein n=1 Tax=Theobroma cacao TaxID=3641 RepID=A0A061E761_THECC|nr:Uncharacterized protein TCM_006942 [Theobroma cacao]